LIEELFSKIMENFEGNIYNNFEIAPLEWGVLTPTTTPPING